MEKFHGGIQSEADLQKRWDALNLGDLKGKRVLDVGAAEGWFSKKCQDAGAEVTAVEPVRAVLSEIEVISDHFDRLGVMPSECLPPCVFGTDYDREFDIVLMLRVLYHMKVPQMALRRASWALKPGGVLYLENWFEDPAANDSVTMQMYEDKPDGWRFVPSPACVARLLIHYGFEDLKIIHQYQSDQRQIWCATKSIK